MILNFTKNRQNMMSEVNNRVWLSRLLKLLKQCPIDDSMQN
jgi:hypothetical protein